MVGIMNDDARPRSMCTGSIRLFVPDDLHAGAGFALAPGQAHYLGNVMRRGVGDSVLLFNGRGGEWMARLAAIRRDRAEVVVGARVREQRVESDLWLAFAPLKRDATDWVVEKATELGVAAILPVLTERTNTGRINLERLRGIATEAAEQCERLSVPEIRPPISLPELIAGWPTGRDFAVAMERAGAPLAHGLPGAGGLLVGPEGGFSERDRTVILACPMARAVSLGPGILRAETAAVVGLALLRFAGSG